MNTKEEIKKYLESTQIMQIATSKDNQPWSAVVYFAFDDNLNLYWMSRQDRRHSQELEQNPKTSGAIVKHYTYGEKVRGVQVEGVAEKLIGGEAEAGTIIYTNRYGAARERVKNLLVGAVGESFVIYRLKPSKFVLFDEVNFPDNPRQEINVS